MPKIKKKQSADLLNLLGLAATSLAAIFGLLYYSSANFNPPHPNKSYAVQAANISQPTTATPAIAPTETIRLLFLGDLMFDRWIRNVSQKKGADYVFAPMKSFLASNDLVIANLEGPITDNASVSIGTSPGDPSHLTFTFDPALAAALYRHNITLVNLGNNHILNFGASGLAQTKAQLDAQQVRYFGCFGNNDSQPLVVALQGLKIGFVNYNQFSTGCPERALSEVQALNSQVDLIFVYAHWGNEYQNHSAPSTQRAAHALIDAGADLIIGSHPHVVQEKENYRGRTIYYSLGNFIFDQYFDPQTQQGLALEIKIDPKDYRLSFREAQIRLQRNGQTVVSKAK